LKSKSQTTHLTILSLIATAIFGYVTYRQLKVGDYADHIEWAGNLADKGYIFIPSHSLFEQLTVAVRALLPYDAFARFSKLFRQIIELKSYEIAVMLICVLAYLAVANLIFTRLTRERQADGKKSDPWFAGFLTLAAMIVGPIFLFTFPERMYIGYITPNPYHNPTQILLRPFALLCFWHAFSNLYSRFSFHQVLVAAILIIVATESKASFTLTFLPAIGLLALIQYRKLKEVNWGYLIFGLGLPGMMMLAIQFLISSYGAGTDSMILAPFLAILQFVPNIWVFFVFFLLSILFPLLITFLYWEQTRNDLRLSLAWLNLLVALLLAILFTQVINMKSLNFFWGLSIAAFLLFVETISLARKLGAFSFKKSAGRLQRLLISSAFALHLICGILFYFKSVLFPSAYL